MNRIVTLVVLFAAALPAAGQEMPPAPVETAAAKKQLVAPLMWVPGSVISRETSRVAAEVTGNLVYVAEVGDVIEQGQPLARLNDRELQLQLRNDRAVVARFDARLDYLGRQVERLARLASTNATAEAELDQLKAERAMLVQEQAAAQVALERTQYDLERTRVAAPFSGVVVERMLQPGEFVDRGSAIVLLVGTSALEIRAQAPLSVARYVRSGDVVDVKKGGDLVRTPVRSVIPVGDERSRMLELRLRLEGGGWVIGEAVTVGVHNGTAVESITVPRDALILREGESFIFVVQADNTARRVKVVPGDGAGDHIVVRGDLSEGDRVVVRGAERLRDGRAVTIISEKIAGR